jgi:tryptophan synthase alpha chain
LNLIEEMVKVHGDRCDFLVMTYLNIPYQRGYPEFARELKQCGVIGTIIPDLPLESNQTFEVALQKEGLFNIRLVAPHGDWARTDRVLGGAQELVYVVARKGVTGSPSAFNQDLNHMLDTLRRKTDCSLAVGFGVKSGADIRKLAGHADYVVVGTASLEAWMSGGEAAFRALWSDLGSAAREIQSASIL